MIQVDLPLTTEGGTYWFPLNATDDFGLPRQYYFIDYNSDHYDLAKSTRSII